MSGRCDSPPGGSRGRALGPPSPTSSCRKPLRPSESEVLSHWSCRITCCHGPPGGYVGTSMPVSYFVAALGSVWTLAFPATLCSLLPAGEPAAVSLGASQGLVQCLRGRCSVDVLLLF